jgi:hypothetical protein
LSRTQLKISGNTVNVNPIRFINPSPSPSLGLR